MRHKSKLNLHPTQRVTLYFKIFYAKAVTIFSIKEIYEKQYEVLEV